MANNKRTVDIPELRKGGTYSHAVIHNNVAYLSGITGVNDSRDNTFASQFSNIFNAVGKILNEVGTTEDNILKTVFYLSDAKYFGELNRLFSEEFRESPPARTTIVCKFAKPETLLEVDVTVGI